MNLKIIISLLFGFFLLSLINDQPTSYLELLETRVLSYPNEKVYIHHDKPVYAPGDDIWFKVYLVDARTHFQSTPSRLVYVDLVNNLDSVVATRAIKIDSSYNSGDISIPSDLKKGNYVLRGYTNYMRNFDEAYFFNKRIKIIDDESNQTQFQNDLPLDEGSIELDFFPEGGNLISGLKNRVAFKCIDEKGIGRQIEGRVVDSEGKHVAILKALHKGMGYFEIEPEQDIAYSVIIQWNGSEQEYPLPKSYKNGYTLEVNNTSADYFTIKVNNKKVSQLKNAFILGHIRGEPYVVLQEIENGKRFKLSKDQLPEGILHLTLFDSKSRPAAERLIFVENNKSVIHLNTKLISKDVGPKELVKIELAVAKKMIDTVGIANLSIAITDEKLLPADAGIDIANYLLLDADLKGSVEDIQYYFTDRTRKKRVLLDLVMMTNGWRRFNWSDIIEEKEPSVSYPPESGFEIAGVVTKNNKSGKTVIADVFLTVMNNDFQMHQMTTNSDGRFVFSEMEIEGSVPLVLQANEHQSKKRKNKDEGPSGKRHVDIILDSPSYPLFDLQNNQILGFIDQKTNYIQYTDVLKNKLELNELVEGEMSIDLSEITVKGKRISAEKKLDRPGQLYKDPDNRIILDAIPGLLASRTVFDIVRMRVPGVEIIGVPGIDAEFRIRGISSINLPTTATVLVDGMPATPGYVNTLTADRIEYIDVIKGLSKTAVYGAAGANGVIAVYTKGILGQRRANQNSVNGILNSSLDGYYLAREFYTPNYLISPNNQGLPDFRPTLYWNPNVVIDQKSKAILEFYTAQKTSTYRMDVQGITSNGVPVIGSMVFEVR
jgi:hypothetical protein